MQKENIDNNLTDPIEHCSDLMDELINQLQDLNGDIDENVVEMANYMNNMIIADEMKILVSENGCRSPFLCLENINLTTELLEFLLDKFSHLINIPDEQHIDNFFENTLPPLSLICKNKTVELEHIKLMVEYGAKINLFNYESDPEMCPIPILCSENQLVGEKLDIIEYLISIDGEETCQDILFFLCSNRHYRFDNVEQMKKIISMCDGSIVFNSAYFGHDIFSMILDNNKYKNQEMIDLLKSYGATVDTSFDRLTLTACELFCYNCVNDTDNIYNYIGIMKTFLTDNMINYLIEYIDESDIPNKEDIIYELSTLTTDTKSAAKL
jgi:hypothetical protein